MSDLAIEASGLGKRYALGRNLAPYHTLRESIMRLARPGSAEANGQGDFWALQDVDFTVARGETLGLVGRNGAGKSTLLKILSRITAPTAGSVRLHGRVGSLLEVGTGFHPELSGRDNVYLNGAILGMRRAEIRRRFDDIVSFAGVGKFIDTPVKRYSSGMHMRLAFAVAAHLETEILLVDEVLAVGDVEFQKRCLGKMQDVASAGRTVIFVSHNLQAVTQLCRRAMVLKGGRITAAGDAQPIVRAYLAQISSDKPQDIQDQIRSLPADSTFRLLNLGVVAEGDDDHGADGFVTSKPINVTLEYELLESRRDLWVGIDVLAADGTVLFRSHDDDAGARCRDVGHYTASCTIPAHLLMPGDYSVNLLVALHPERWVINGSVTVRLPVVQVEGVNPLYIGEHVRPGYIQPTLDWHVDRHS
jgi:lipopolysaccharide transport system ATP-binding protein